MNVVKILFNCGFMDINCVSSLVFHKDAIVIYMAFGSTISLDISAIKNILFNGKEMNIE